MKKRTWITADELMAELNSDPKYVAERARKEEELANKEREWRRAEAPLIQDLRAIGVVVASAWDLVNKAGKYPKALPVLLHHLQRPYPDPVREGIARALGVREAKFGWQVLIQLYQIEREARAKDGLAAALAAIADDETISDVITLVTDTRHGPSRLLLLSALERSSDPSAYKTLIDLQNDPDLKKEIEIILRRLNKKRRSGEAKKGSSVPLRSAMGDLSEASMNFDADMVGPFLEQLARLVGGFGPGQIEEVLEVVNKLDVDAERQLHFRVRYRGEEMLLNIQIFKDDIDALDLYFFGPASLIEKIRNLMSDFCEESGV